MPHELTIATAQFENRSGDKAYNLATIEDLSAKAARSGASVAAFHGARSPDTALHGGCRGSSSGTWLAMSGGHRYREARKPELYGHILGAEHRSEQTVPWMSGRGGS